MNEYRLIGERIARARALRGLTQMELGASIGVSDQTVSNWEVGLRTPRADMLLRLCWALGCSADWLLGLSDDLAAPEGRQARAETQRA